MGSLRFIFGFFVFLWSAMSFAQEEETILWHPKQRLSWSNFKAEPVEGSKVAATTASGLSYQFSTTEEGGKYELDYTISTYFYPDRSWYQPKICDEVILSHEQLHFDISELFGRKMRKIMDTTTFTKNVKAEVKAIYRQINKELAEFQQLYDQETNYSRNIEQQLSWNQKIKDALRN
ncbi:DUF922 domain-containing protein [uncultured Eudoraea sp.]|uniref:DUF922 domain-containing protein n=1 Tax=uncultured Eudoraea sp. TaxID=1035614 RepID=UPI00260A5CFF|nr:DUF922 domain-containing protein [uncultured Eudoraea sp.]